MRDLDAVKFTLVRTVPRGQQDRLEEQLEITEWWKLTARSLRTWDLACPLLLLWGQDLPHARRAWSS